MCYRGTSFKVQGGSVIAAFFFAHNYVSEQFGNYVEYGMFIESLDKIFTGNKPKTSMFICGDFNIDLLKYEEHVGSAKFIDTMYSNGLYPLIDKPTRITQQ